MATDEMLLQITEMIKNLADSIERLSDGQEQLFDGQKQLSDDLSAFKDETNSRFDKIDERLDRIENRVTENYNAIETLMYKQDDMEKEITAINLRIENKIDKSLALLSESAISDSERLRALEDDVRDIKDDRVIDEVIQGLKERKLIS